MSDDSALARTRTWFSEHARFLLLLFLGLALLRLIFTVYVDQDDYEGVQTAWLMMQGQHVYVDFLQHHHPLSYLLYMPIISLVGEDAFTLLACRLVSWAFSVGILVLVSRIVRKLGVPFWAEALALFSLAVCYGFFVPGLQVRPDPSMLFFALWGIDVLVERDGSVSGRASRHWLSGALMGISFCFLQKTLFMMAATGLGLFLKDGWRKPEWRGAFRYAGGVAAVVLPFVFLLSVYVGGFENYFFWNWWLNANLPKMGNYNGIILRVFGSSPLLVVFGLMGTMLAFRERASGMRLVALNLLVVFFSMLVVTKAKWVQYFLPAVVFAAILSGKAYATLLSRRAALAWATALSFLFLLPGMFLGSFRLKTLLSDVVERDLRRTDFILQYVSPDETVFDDAPHAALFRYSCTPFYWWSRFPNGVCETVFSLRGEVFDRYAGIAEKRPVVIAVPPHPELQYDYSNPLFKRYSYRSDLRLFLRKDFAKRLEERFESKQDGHFSGEKP